MNLGAMLSGQRILITGASSGLGNHFARLAASCGAQVVIGARRTSRLEALAVELQALGAQQVTSIELDVACQASVTRAFATIAETGKPLDVLVNNAGIGHEGLALTQPLEQFDDIIATNLRGVWLVATEAARAWKAQGQGGSIINIASIQGERVMPGVAAYSASKAAVVHLTKSLALEWARHGIRVNAIAPGYISTEMTQAAWDTPQGAALIKRIPMQRLGTPQELDGALLLLATPASSWMTGSMITVDGGHLLSSL
ncbi:SDR family NAD(P)-dependent oxidoreductase [Pseudomonas vancouverensis]|uniref:SDR family NAD(P)-dependent oxidoreductase n=1 Tax=Pseudomonas vancouverensis TaxID=95300 RepID=UPI003D0141C8